MDFADDLYLQKLCYVFYNELMKKVYLSRRAGSPLVEFLAEQGYEINTVTEYGIVNQNTTSIDDALGLIRNENGTLSSDRPMHVDPRLATHADIYMCQLGLWNEAGIFLGDRSKLAPKYPNDIIYNAVCTKNFVIHLIEKTDRDLMDSIVAWRNSLNSLTPGEMKIIGVRQGYARCMCLPVDNDAFIVADEALARPLEGQGAKVLRIERGHVKLLGFEYGFLGGSAGNVYIKTANRSEQKAIVFNGDLSVHPDFKRITFFIKSRNILPVWFEDYALEDIGSVLAIE